MFPYNTDGDNQPIGAPLDNEQAMDLAFQILEWHHEHYPENWSLSGSQTHPDALVISFGLMAMLADPGHMAVLKAMGEHVKHSAETLMEVRDFKIKNNSATRL